MVGKGRVSSMATLEEVMDSESESERIGARKVVINKFISGNIVMISEFSKRS